jgi:two-component system, NtrC family, sensor kinase
VGRAPRRVDRGHAPDQSDHEGPDLTGFSRERGKALIDLVPVANSAIRIAMHETKGRAEVVRSFDHGVVAEVRGARVAQVLLNLIVNAAQAIPPGDPARHHITVRVFRDGDASCIEVADTGPGIPADVGERIFEPFYTTRDAGTGLGLWLSRSIVEEEGGTLTYKNLTGGGACFRVSLPSPRVEDRASEPRLSAGY